MRRAGRPGLIGLAARTAVVTGTANAMGNRAHSKRLAQEQAAQQQAAAQQAAWQQQQAQQAAFAAPQAPAAPAPSPAATGGVDLTAELMKLADLRTQGLLTDEEFAAAKAKLLG
ncbi:SHOCT domain-containing protein [Gordonia iterans]